MNPLVSVVVPVYNNEEFICAAIESILNQTFSSLEILIVDDASTDHSWEMIAGSYGYNPRVKCFRNQENKGVAVTRNVGLQHATGKYLAFLDADDLWLNTHLQRGVSFLESHEHVDGVFFNSQIVHLNENKPNVNWFDARGFRRKIATQPLTGGYHLIRENLFLALLDESFIHLQSLILKREICRRQLFDETFTGSEDREIMMRLYLNEHIRLALHDEVTSIYHRHAKNQTATTIAASKQANERHICLFLLYLSQFANDPIVSRKLKRLLFDRMLASAYYHRQLRDYGESFKAIRNSTRYRLSLRQIVELAKTALHPIL